MVVRDPLPPNYYYFFWTVEPMLTIAGAYVAIFRPEQYAADLLPPQMERVTKMVGSTTRGQIVIGGLGSCFFLLAMISLSFFYTVKHHVPVNLQEKVVKSLLIPLAIADLIHITLTLLPLPISHLQSPSEWTYVMHGNVGVTVFLFLYRTCYFLGLGRAVTPAEVSIRKAKAVEAIERNTTESNTPELGQPILFEAGTDDELKSPRKSGRRKKAE